MFFVVLIETDCLRRHSIVELHMQMNNGYVENEAEIFK